MQIEQPRRQPSPAAAESRPARRDLAWRSGERPTNSRGLTIFQVTGSAFPDGCADLRVFPV